MPWFDPQSGQNVIGIISLVVFGAQYDPSDDSDHIRVEDTMENRDSKSKIEEDMM